MNSNEHLYNFNSFCKYNLKKPLLSIILKGGKLTMKQKTNKNRYNFRNFSEYEEELEELGINPAVQEKEIFEEGISQVKNRKIKRDEDVFFELIQKGLDKKEAAHIINRIAEKRLRYLSQ